MAMKKIGLIMLLVTLIGCVKHTEPTEDKYAPENDIVVVEVQGHEYLIWNGHKKGGIVHSASCPCHLKTLEDSIHYYEDGM